MSVVTAITTAKAIEIFKSINSSFIGLTTATIPTLAGGKSNPMQGRVRKVSTFVAMIGNSHDYSNKITRGASKEAEEFFGEAVELQPFQAEKLWKGAGEHVSGAVVRHKGTDDKYLFYFPAPNTSASVHYELDGKKIEKEQITGLVEKSREGKAVSVINEDGQEELTIVLKVFPTTLKMSSIREFRLDGQNYMIVENI